MPSYLESLQLDAEATAFITQNLDAIRLNNAHSIRLRVENGHRLLAMKDTIRHGGWMDWVVSEEANSGYHSTRTVERDMRIGAALYGQLEGITDEALATRTNLTALRALAGDSDAEALNTAIRLIQQGGVVRGETVRDLAAIHEVEPRLGESIVAGKMTIKDALAVAHKIAEIEPHPEVVDLVVAAGVRAPAMVDALALMHQTDHAQFESISASGTIYSVLADQEVPLSEASRADGTAALITKDAEREARRLEVLLSWKAKRGERLVDVRGSRAEVLAAVQGLPESDGQFRVIVYPEIVEHAPAAG